MTHRSSTRYGGEGKAALSATCTEGEAATWCEGSHVAVTMAAARPHGSWERRIMVVRTRQQFYGGEVTTRVVECCIDRLEGCLFQISTMGGMRRGATLDITNVKRHSSILCVGGVIERCERNKKGQVKARNSL